jgi:hypothetical protein
MRTILVWVVLTAAGLAGKCAADSPFACVDLGGRFGIVRTGGHLDDVQLLAAEADHQRFCAVARIDQLRQTGVELVHSWLVQGVDVHRKNGERSFVACQNSTAQWQARIGQTSEPRFTKKDSA